MADRKTVQSVNKKRKRAAYPGRFLIARLLALICFVLVIFEGPVIYRLFTHKVDTDRLASNGEDLSGTIQENSISNSSQGNSDENNNLYNAGEIELAGAGTISESSDNSAEKISETIDSPKVVQAQEIIADDSYFNDAVFIGDSRMEGFRNSSGITQGTFLTSVSLSMDDMDSQVISSSSGNISVYQGLSGRQYDKIYLMLGVNDLGYYSWDNFLSNYENILAQFHQLQPDAIIYVCSVIYVDESKISTTYEYDNNDNVRKVNGYLLDACEDLWYCYYINLNEIFTDGYGELISDASSDGIHLYSEYLEKMLNYLKTHYIPYEEFAIEASQHETESLLETEGS